MDVQVGAAIITTYLSIFLLNFALCRPVRCGINYKNLLYWKIESIQLVVHKTFWVHER